MVSDGIVIPASAAAGPNPAVRRWRALTYCTAACVAAIGCTSLLGWILHLPLLRSIVPGAVEMKSNTASTLICAALALVLLSRAQSNRMQRLGQWLALFVVAGGALTLGEYLWNWPLGIDELLFRDTAIAFNPIPGRMSPYSTVAFVAIGMAIFCLRYRASRWTVLLGAILATAIGAVSLLGYLWNATELTTDLWLPPVAFHSAIAFICLGVGTLAADRSIEVAALLEHHVPFKERIELKVLMGFIAALALFGLGGGITYRMGVNFSNSAAWVTHTQMVRRALADLNLSLTEAESAQRRYLFLGRRGRPAPAGTREPGSHRSSAARALGRARALHRHAAARARNPDRELRSRRR
jgi:hypothetical protein